METTSKQLIDRARAGGLAIPAFNIPYLPMMQPVIQAIVDADAVAFIESARLEWYKFEAKGPGPIATEFKKYAGANHVRLHLDHVPVVDEDDIYVDYLPIIQEAIALGFDSVMVDASRLSLEENIAATSLAVQIAHAAGVPCEAELGAVLGHESGPLPPYEELYTSGKGFTDIDEAARFSTETGCDWLSVAIGNIHGAVSGAQRDAKKVEARLNLDHLEKLSRATDLPLVLHGGTGIRKEYLREAMKRGIAKINVGTEIRQAYESAFREAGTVVAAQEAVYHRTFDYLSNDIEVAGKRSILTNERINA
ncbi:MAG: class II fructose-bisphosphate aldolase [Candidatus Hydrogenedentes bacterium]|nr:class II fructose-bisphosphate aldolase [Candidatus Hydrogenedentota bacterium]